MASIVGHVIFSSKVVVNPSFGLDHASDWQQSFIPCCLSDGLHKIGDCQIKFAR